MKFYYRSIILLTALIINFALAQDVQKDKGKFIESKNEYYNKIRESIDKYTQPEKKPKMVFKMDFTGIELPDTITQFTRQWYQ